MLVQNTPFRYADLEMMSEAYYMGLMIRLGELASECPRARKEWLEIGRIRKKLNLRRVEPDFDDSVEGPEWFSAMGMHSSAVERLRELNMDSRHVSSRSN